MVLRKNSRALAIDFCVPAESHSNSNVAQLRKFLLISGPKNSTLPHGWAINTDSQRLESLNLSRSLIDAVAIPQDIMHHANNGMRRVVQITVWENA